MKNLTTAIMSRFTDAPGSVHNDLYDAIGGRLFDTEAPEGAEYPYVTYLVVSDLPDKTFTEDFEDVLIQFSIFSKASSSGEAKDIFADLKALYDDCALTITDSTLVWMKRASAGPIMTEDHTTPDGTQKVWHFPVEYEIKTSLN